MTINFDELRDLDFLNSEEVDDNFNQFMAWCAKNHFDFSFPKGWTLRQNFGHYVIQEGYCPDYQYRLDVDGILQFLNEGV